MSVQKTVLLLGASGLTGGHCLDLLLADERVAEVRVLTRRPLGRAVDPASARLVESCFERNLAEQVDAFAGVDVVICCLGTTIRKAGSQTAFRRVDFELCLEAAQLAKQQGVTAFAIISAVNANSRGISFYARTKGELEDALQALGLPQLILAKPSLLLGERDDRRPLETFAQLLSKPLAPLLAKLSPASTPMSARQLAQALVNVSLQPQADAVLVLRYPELVRLARYEPNPPSRSKT